MDIQTHDFMHKIAVDFRKILLDIERLEKDISDFIAVKGRQDDERMGTDSKENSI